MIRDLKKMSFLRILNGTRNGFYDAIFATNSQHCQVQKWAILSMSARAWNLPSLGGSGAGAMAGKSMEYALQKLFVAEESDDWKMVNSNGPLNFKQYSVASKLL